MKRVTLYTLCTLMLISTVVVNLKASSTIEATEYSNSTAYAKGTVVWYTVSGKKEYFKCTHEVKADSYNVPSKGSWYWQELGSDPSGSNTPKKPNKPIKPENKKLPIKTDDIAILIVSGNPQAHGAAGENEQIKAAVELFLYCQTNYSQQYTTVLLIGSEGLDSNYLTTTQSHQLTQYKELIYPATKTNVLACLSSKKLFAFYYNGDGFNDSITVNNSEGGMNDNIGIGELIFRDYNYKVSFILDACDVFCTPFAPIIMYIGHVRNFMGGYGELLDVSSAPVSKGTLIGMLNKKEEIIDAWKKTIDSNPTYFRPSTRHFYGGHWGISNGPSPILSVYSSGKINSSYWDAAKIFSVTTEKQGGIIDVDPWHKAQEYKVTIKNISDKNFSLNLLLLPIENPKKYSWDIESSNWNTLSSNFKYNNKIYCYANTSLKTSESSYQITPNNSIQLTLKLTSYGSFTTPPPENPTIIALPPLKWDNNPDYAGKTNNSSKK